MNVPRARSSINGPPAQQLRPAAGTPAVGSNALQMAPVGASGTIFDHSAKLVSLRAPLKMGSFRKNCVT